MLTFFSSDCSLRVRVGSRPCVRRVPILPSDYYLECWYSIDSLQLWPLGLCACSWLRGCADHLITFLIVWHWIDGMNKASRRNLEILTFCSAMKIYLSGNMHTNVTLKGRRVHYLWCQWEKRLEMLWLRPWWRWRVPNQRAWKISFPRPNMECLFEWASPRIYSTYNFARPFPLGSANILTPADFICGPYQSSPKFFNLASQTSIEIHFSSGTIHAFL